MNTKIVLVLATLFLFSEVGANNQFIPNHYRSGRALNSEAAIGWSDRKEIGFTHEYNKSINETNGQSRGSTIGRTSGSYLFYRTPIDLNVELGFASLTTKERPAEPLLPNTESQLALHIASIGYELPGAPIAFGFSFVNAHQVIEHDDFTAHGRLINMGGGIRVSDGIYLGLGYNNIHYKSEFGRSTDHTFTVGGGLVVGEKELPFFAGESAISFSNQDGVKYHAINTRGLFNLQQATQLYGTVMHHRFKRETSTSTNWQLISGVDHQISNFYLAPEFSIGWDKTDGETFEVDGSDIGASLEAGIRPPNLEFSVRYGRERRKTDFKTEMNSEQQRKIQTITVNAAYLF